MNESPKQSWLLIVAKWGLPIVAIVEGVLAAVFNGTITSNALEFIGFLIVCLFAIILKMQGRVHKKKGLWFLGAFITYQIFIAFGATVISGSLGLIKQSEPEYLVNARKDQTSAQGALDDLRKKQSSGQYSQSTKEMTDQITASETSKTKADNALQVAIDKSKNQSISGIEVFSRIPLLIKTAVDIWQTDSVHAIGIFNAVIFILLFGAFIEAAMIFLVKILQNITPGIPMTRRRKREEQPPAEELVQQWVDINYMALQSGNSDKIIDREVFKKFCADRNIKFTDGAYRAILSAANQTGVLRADGVIIEKIKTEAVKKILTTTLKWRSMNRGGWNDSSRQDDSS